MAEADSHAVWNLADSSPCERFFFLRFDLDYLINEWKIEGRQSLNIPCGGLTFDVGVHRRGPAHDEWNFNCQWVAQSILYRRFLLNGKAISKRVQEGPRGHCLSILSKMRAAFQGSVSIFVFGCLILQFLILCVRPWDFVHRQVQFNAIAAASASLGEDISSIQEDRSCPVQQTESRWFRWIQL